MHVENATLTLELPRYGTTPKPDRVAAGRHCLSIAMSSPFLGLSAVLLTYPLDIVRTRLAFQSTGEHFYTGVLHTLQSIMQHEGGVKALYRGIVPTILGMVPYAGKIH